MDIMSFKDDIWNGELSRYTCLRTEECSGEIVIDSYIKDIFVYNNSWGEHLRTLKELFGWSGTARITA